MRLLGPGYFFGDMSLVHKRPVSANVTALTACKLFVLRKQVGEGRRGEVMGGGGGAKGVGEARGVEGSGRARVGDDGRVGVGWRRFGRSVE